jgi:long-chain acyl-CoA synthetase
VRRRRFARRASGYRPTVIALPDAVRRTDPSAVALIAGDVGGSLTYGALADRIDRTAGGLRERGVGPGRLVAVAVPLGIDGIVAYLGVQAAGAAAVMLYPRSPRPELEARLAAIETDLLIVGDDVAYPSGIAVARPAGATGHSDLPTLDAPAGELEPVDPESPAAILFTSGVAGAPRPVRLTHTNLGVVQLGMIEQPSSGLGRTTVALALLPISHVFGLNSLVGTMLRAGAAIVTLDRFDPLQSLELVARHGVTAISAVPQMWSAWSRTDAPDDAMRTVTRATSSAAHLPPDVAERIRERFGVRVAAGYGLTETGGTICLDDPLEPVLNTVGRPLAGTEIRLVDDDGEDAEPGDPAEIWLRGGSVFAGYAGAFADQAALEPGGWLRTGDIGVVADDGRLMIVDRVKDVIIVGGFNVTPTEVEDVLLLHPTVSAALVVGEADDRSGERVVAYVVPHAGATIDAAALVEHCAANVARYKVPARIEVRDDVPTTTSGKTVRRLLP